MCFNLGSSAGKEFACNAGDPGLIPGLGSSPEEGIGIHSSIPAWRIPMDRGSWWATVYGDTRVRHDQATKHNTHTIFISLFLTYFTLLYNWS